MARTRTFLPSTAILGSRSPHEAEKQLQVGRAQDARGLDTVEIRGDLSDVVALEELGRDGEREDGSYNLADELAELLVVHDLLGYGFGAGIAVDKTHAAVEVLVLVVDVRVSHDGLDAV